MKLHAANVSFAFGEVPVLDNVSLTVEPGRCVAVVGESGAGKTTLLRCFNRMVVPTSGTVDIDGADVATQPVAELRRRLGYLPQHGGLLPHWTVLRNVALVPDLLHQADVVGAARAALDHVGLPAPFANRYPNELSGGQRQRVALARAIAGRQAVLLMDEPFGSLDAISRSELQVLCGTLRRELRVTTLLVTHDLLEADLIADEIAVMRAGRIEQLGTLQTLIAEPATAYVTSLLDRAVPRHTRPA